MKISEYAGHDGLALAALIAKGEVSAAEVKAAALQAIAALNPRVNAVIESWDDDAPSAASAPFAGVPFLVKDIVGATAGRRNELGSRLAAGVVAGADSHLMTRFRAAGLVTIGRTTTPEMGTSTTTESVATGPTRNPWDPARNAGGSSGGSAAAIAAGMVPVAHATDGGGSIRVPASMNGLFGLKPSRGRVSNGPALDEVWGGLAVQFALSRSVRDSAALMDAVHGGAVGEPYYIPAPERTYLTECARPPDRLRIGLVVDPPNGARAAAGIAAATRDAALLCADLGHAVEEISLDLGVSWEAFVHAHAQFWTTNTAGWVDAVAAATGRPIDETTLEPATLAEWRYGRAATALDLLGAFFTRNIVSRTVGGQFTRYDIVLSPAVPELPLPIGAYNQAQAGLDGLGWVDHVFRRSPFTALYNMTGQPAMSVPLGMDGETGLPIGIQFAAGFGREDLLFRLAGQLETARPWAGRKPRLWAGDLP
ncbi:MAG: amidase [Reyranella sp.]|nr:amidase [Reyranella sp.]